MALQGTPHTPQRSMITLLTLIFIGQLMYERQSYHLSTVMYKERHTHREVNDHAAR
jgi:hypothetical protein